VDGFVRAGQTEQAFMTALGASNVELTRHACLAYDVASIFHSDAGCIVSQTVLVCLMQQLGSSLGAEGKTDFDLELDWLQEIAVVIDSSDPQIGSHVKGVQQQLVGQTQKAIERTQGKDKRKLTGLLAMVRGIVV
jgi:hypothetical protein